MRVELLYFGSCPHHEAFLPRLRMLLDEAGVSDPVELIEVETEQEAQRLGFLGSPSLRIDGTDVDPTAHVRRDFGMQCRIYRTPDGSRGTPPDEWVRGALGR